MNFDEFDAALSALIVQALNARVDPAEIAGALHGSGVGVAVRFTQLPRKVLIDAVNSGYADKARRELAS